MGLTMGTFTSVMNIGFILGALFGGIIMDTLGINAIFYLSGFCGIMSVGIFVNYSDLKSTAYQNLYRSTSPAVMP
jgi:predicted MFS family arabinose efflux permease